MAYKFLLKFILRNCSHLSRLYIAMFNRFGLTKVCISHIFPDFVKQNSFILCVSISYPILKTKCESKLVFLTDLYKTEWDKSNHGWD